MQWANGLALLSYTFHCQKVFGIRKTSQNVYSYVAYTFMYNVNVYIQTHTLSFKALFMPLSPFILLLLLLICYALWMNEEEKTWKSDATIFHARCVVKTFGRLTMQKVQVQATNSKNIIALFIWLYQMVFVVYRVHGTLLIFQVRKKRCDFWEWKALKGS